ncbi:TIGR00303 family protein, partial [Sulfolobus sp. B1]
NKLKDITIGTTRWIIEDKSADMLGLVKQVDVKLMASMIDLSLSSFDGIKSYEKGFVKEGVGAGGASIMAFIRGVSNQELVKRIDEQYKKLINS